MRNAVTLRDLTERRRMYAERRQARWMTARDLECVEAAFTLAREVR